MKSILIIGTGHFGSHLCMNLSKLNNEIMIVDKCEEQLEDLLPFVTSAKIGDCTNAKVLESLGISNFDLCVVCIGDSFQDNLEITSLLKDLGAKKVVSKANRDLHVKFLLRNGADKVIFPDRDIAQRLAVQLSSDNILDCFHLSDEYAVFEITPFPEWIGKSVLALNFRSKYHLSIIGIRLEDKTEFLPDADYVFKENERLIVIGRQEDMNRIVSTKRQTRFS